ncbi:hypothetical protein NM208_g3403 [Fusarium decemcellulare]|uniref:Uncharacterized protein n=2 Tax=Fusarium decemcellulare TaxID=57161 RepID=A0ACC1SPQ2_9HYPO|nr:hypothetical protein NM208_g4171 [Fusarium decemcellulare]KAJ3543769.1 hypothetical protein NM208_g3403 [Fusarium decemcellulare]
MSLQFSTIEKVKLAFRLTCLAPWQILASMIQSLVIALSRGLPPRLFVVCAVIKVILATFSPRQIQYLSSSTRETYKSWVHRRLSKAKRNRDSAVTKRLSYNIEPLEDGHSSLLWIGDRRKASKIVLFLHGGGYISPLLPGHLEWCWRSYVSAGIEMNTEVAVGVLEYTLCPIARYPVQLRQAASALSFLLSHQIRPRDIIVGGDSAGANLTAQLLCHLIKPHPAVQKVTLTEPLAGACLVSPWLTRHTSDASYAENACIDMLSASIVEKSTRELLGHMDVDEKRRMSANLAFPLDREKDTFRGMDSVVQQLYVVVGGHEVFRDQAVAFVHEVERANPRLNVRFDVQGQQAHDFILLEGQEERDGDCIQEMRSWMKDILAVGMKNMFKEVE